METYSTYSKYVNIIYIKFVIFPFFDIEFISLKYSVSDDLPDNIAQRKNVRIRKIKFLTTSCLLIYFHWVNVDFLLLSYFSYAMESLSHTLNNPKEPSKSISRVVIINFSSSFLLLYSTSDLHFSFEMLSFIFENYLPKK